MASGRKARQQARDSRKDFSQKLYIALEDFDFTFTQQEIKAIYEGYEQGLKLSAIAESVDRESEEVIVMLLDLACDKIIKFREVNDDDKERSTKSNY